MDGFKLNPTALPFIPRHVKEERKDKAASHQIVNHYQKKKPKAMTLGSFIRSESRATRAVEKKPKYRKVSVKEENTSRNLLDSTAPKIRRGKEREFPKKKKPSAVKRIILKEKELRLIRLKASKSLLEKRKNQILEKVECGAEDELNSLSTKLDELVIPESVQLQQAGHASNPVDVQLLCKRLFHCSKYRDYCDQVLNDSVDEAATSLISELVRFQENKFAKDPLKARIKRRYTCGLKEASKYIAIVTSARIHNVPVVFALTKKQIAYLCRKKGHVSCIGLLNTEGAQEQLNKLVEVAKLARTEYSDALNAGCSLLSNSSQEELQEIVRRLPGFVPKEFFPLKSRIRMQTYIWLKPKYKKSKMSYSDTLITDMSHLGLH
ncbi:Selenocysteine insertion sequence-binding protein 2 [Halotydeus destructor]|nr:Selenocysteine insertion sequence-binding protein 2 [Halotydeus destructor]